MFKSPTVLLLGAGASAPYGFPLGVTLKREIESNLLALTKAQPSTFGRQLQISTFLNSGYFALREWCLREEPPLFDHEFFYRDITNLLSELRDGPASIDEFARINPRWRDKIKVFVAIEILARIFKPSNQQSYVRDDNSLITSSTGWYAPLVHELRRSANNATDLAENNLQIITFNYDRSLEYYFERQLAREQIFQGFDMRHAPHVLHMHGEIELMMGSFPGQQLDWRDFWPTLFDAARKFVMLDEDRKEHGGRSIEAKNCLAQADQIFVLGYDLHDQNNSLINLHEVAKRCILLNWDGSPRVNQRAIDLGIDEQNIWSGSSDRKREIFTAIEDGLFETRLPKRKVPAPFRRKP